MKTPEKPGEGGDVLDERAEAYLWDPAAPPDPEVERLEELLSPLSFRPGEHPLPGFELSLIHI